MDPALLKKILAAIAAGEDKSGILAEIVASVASEEGSEPAGGDPNAAAADPAAGAPPGEKKDPPPTMNAEITDAELIKLTGAPDATSARRLLKNLPKMAEELDALKAEAVASEVEQRADLVAELVVWGAELPGTAWEGDPDKRIPVKRLASEDLKTLSARVAAFKAAHPERAERDLEPPDPAEEDVKTLSDAELEACRARNLDPKVYLKRKANAVRRSDQ